MADMDVCHVLLERPWNYDVFVFWWFDDKIVLMLQSQSFNINLVAKKDKPVFYQHKRFNLLCCSQIFKEGSLVMLYLCNNRFLAGTCSKLKDKKIGH